MDIIGGTPDNPMHLGGEDKALLVIPLDKVREFVEGLIQAAQYTMEADMTDVMIVVNSEGPDLDKPWIVEMVKLAGLNIEHIDSIEDETSYEN